MGGGKVQNEDRCSAFPSLPPVTGEERKLRALVGQHVDAGNHSSQTG